MQGCRDDMSRSSRSVFFYSVAWEERLEMQDNTILGCEDNLRLTSMQRKSWSMLILLRVSVLFDPIQSSQAWVSFCQRKSCDRSWLNHQHRPRG